MKKVVIVLIIFILLAGTALGFYIYEKNKFVLEIELNENNNIEFGQEFNLKDLIISSNGIFEDKIVKYYELGEKEEELTYKDTHDKIKTYKIKFNIVDKTNPFILSSSSVTAYVGEEPNLLSGVICADYVSNNVKCYTEGEYDINTIGSYPMQYVAEDESGNSVSKGFTLNVKEKPKPTKTTPSKPVLTPFKDIYSKHKKDNTILGIDVSTWQGDIDFNKVKQAGAEFVIIRMGVFNDGKLGMDIRYEDNIKKAYEAGLKIGLYFYSEASTEQEIIDSVNYIVENVHYPLDLGIAYDWEDWSNYNSYHISLYEFNRLGYLFMEKLKEKGYDSIIYGSTNYFRNMWDMKDIPVWVAQYYKEVTYEGKYKMWQLTSSATIDGIYGAVDVDVLYLD